MSEVRDNETEGRFELELEEGTALLTYRRADGALHLMHTEVPPAAGGRGEGSRLVRHALESARERGERVVPLCPFVGAYVERHPEYRPLLRGGDGRP